MSPLSPSTDPVSIAGSHAAQILAAVTAQFGMSETELKLLTEESFVGEGEANAYGFMVLHSTGMYGVYANMTEQGVLENVRVKLL